MVRSSRGEDGARRENTIERGQGTVAGKESSSRRETARKRLERAMTRRENSGGERLREGDDEGREPEKKSETMRGLD